MAKDHTWERNEPFYAMSKFSNFEVGYLIKKKKEEYREISI